jgi:hypothetical protein
LSGNAAGGLAITGLGSLAATFADQRDDFIARPWDTRVCPDAPRDIDRILTDWAKRCDRTPVFGNGYNLPAVDEFGKAALGIEYADGLQYFSLHI